MSFNKTIFITIFFCLAFLLNAQDTTSTFKEYDGENQLLKDIQAELNLVRSNPKEYASSVLFPRLERFNGKNYVNEEGKIITTTEGVKAFRECIEELESTRSMQSLSMEKGLCLAAQFLADDHAKNDSTGHVASDGSNPQVRMERYGFLNGGGENWICGSKTARDVVIFLLVDDGIPSRGHRKNILNPHFRKIGIGFSNQHKTYETACVMDFAVDYLSDRSISLKGISEAEEFQNEGLMEGYSDLSSFIKEIQKEINAARSNPALYASTYIEPLLKRFDGASRLNYNDDFVSTKEGSMAIKECIDALKNLSSVPPLYMEKGLHLSAQELADDLEKNRSRGNKTSSGKTAASRMAEHGRIIKMWNESSWYSLNTARDIVIAMLVDDGVKKRGHRQAILNPEFTKIGIGFASSHPIYKTVAIIDLAYDYESF